MNRPVNSPRRVFLKNRRILGFSRVHQLGSTSPTQQLQPKSPQKHQISRYNTFAAERGNSPKAPLSPQKKPSILLRKKISLSPRSGSKNPLNKINIKKQNLNLRAKKNDFNGEMIHWKLSETIGQSRNSIVHKALDIDSGQTFAVKQLFCTETVPQEVKILESLSHPNIVKYLGYEILRETPCIYLEYIQGGSLKAEIYRMGPLTEHTTKLYTLQILHGLLYLHDQGILHRDIKCSNVLLSADGTVKLTDFGCSRKYLEWKESGVMKSFNGSLAWTAPEVILKSGYGRKADVWSLGCAVLEMLDGKHPWAGNEMLQVVVKLANSQEVPRIPEFVSGDARGFIESCLRRDPAERPTVRELQEHPFLMS